MKIVLATIGALIAFAANSLLCRMALAQGYIDPWHFTAIRLLSAAACLGLIMLIQRYLPILLTVINRPKAAIPNRVNINVINVDETGGWFSSLCLLIYALGFSVAYVALETGTGALILFCAVQFTMMGWGIYKKELLNPVQWFAFIIAVAGFVYFLLPSATTPSPLSALYMAVSGVAWGIYSIRGKACALPMQATGFNFIRSLVALPLLLLGAVSAHNIISIEGILLACASGALASALGYSLWYMTMPLLTNTQAAVVQLCVPIIAAVMGMIFLAEPLTLRFIITSAVIVGAILLFVVAQNTSKVPVSQ
ncbi:DMT family transporter [Psychrobacter sp. 16-MNA-CIBAN-0192]|uniref:DMT family transporter n=1 Tax=Psychrobacter sp. 16-MNA-CIBAN-0192 TaxID=3140448 RepID=UPI00332857A7